MRYPGGKGKTFQHIINLMPPHQVYIETHLGGGAVMRHKRPAQRNIGIDRDDRVIEAWGNSTVIPNLELHEARAEDVLASFQFQGEELVYADPPYFPTTRSRTKVYRHEYGAADHERFLELLLSLPCMVILSGYANSLYDEALAGWATTSFPSKTHAGVRTETLWFNFEPPTELHDPRYIGDSFHERQTTKRRLQRLQERVHRMHPVERTAFAQWLHKTYPPSIESPPP